MVIEVARRLRNDGFNFHINIIGPGGLFDDLSAAVRKNSLDDYVSLLGQKMQDEVRTYMEKSEIFLFTSDEREGWGAVLNESMSSACAVIASHAAGSSPFLIKDGVNGFIFKSKDVDSLYSKVKQLVENESLRDRMCKNAYMTMRNLWNARTACHNLLALSKALLEGADTPILEGPCSRAEIINHTWM